MKKLIPLFFVSSLFAQENPYDTIAKRNAFALLEETPAKVEVPKLIEQLPIKLNLTGIITRGGVTNVYMFSKDIPKRFLTLSSKKRTDSGVTLLSVERGLVKVDNNGVTELLSFDTHKLPSIVTLPKLNTKPTIIKKKDDKSKPLKTTPATPKPNIVTVPSRRPKIDPRVVQKGLEYLNKIDNPKKKQAMLERLEKFQRGDYDKEIRERMQKYEEYRKSKDRKK
tara:strand:+ start:1996 stop:2667 length:672 start_codon:yes stop_codon:yes gene_type:complete